MSDYESDEFIGFEPTDQPESDVEVYGLEEDDGEDVLERLQAKLGNVSDQESEDDEDAQGGWGSKRSAYYNADDDSSDDEAAQQEEKEAERLQREHVAAMGDQDYVDDSLEAMLLKNTMPNADRLMTSNLDSLTPQEQTKAFKLMYPCLFQLKQQASSLPKESSVKQNIALMNLAYCQLAAMNGASNANIMAHPAFELASRLFKELKSNVKGNKVKKSKKMKLSTVQEMDQDMDNDIENEEVEEYLESVNKLREQRASEKSKKATDYIETVTAYRDSAARLDESLTQGKRGATWNILTNKGLTPHRKKIDRNPRVKKRVKYDQAKKKLSSFRRLAVDKSTLKHYEGERTGIKANLSRSVRF